MLERKPWTRSMQTAILGTVKYFCIPNFIVFLILYMGSSIQQRELNVLYICYYFKVAKYFHKTSTAINFVLGYLIGTVISF